MIKNIIFDNGGVIVSCSAKYFIPLFAPYSDKSVKTLTQSYRELAKNLDTGYESEKHFYARFAKHMGLQCHWRTIHKLRYSIAHHIPGVIAIIKRLSKKYNLYMLNNEYKEFMQFLLKRDGYFKHFKGRVTSYQVHCRKPDAKIYKILLKRYVLKPHESVFIDDRLDNVHTARKLGIHAIHFKDAKQLQRELKKLGVEL